MSKGFGNTNNIDRKKQAFKRAIEAHDIDKLRALIDHYSMKGLSGENLTNTVTEVVNELPLEDHNWFYKSILSPEKYQQMQDMAQAIMVESLVEEGCEIGKDFSKIEIDGEHCFMFSDKAQQTILGNIPEEHYSKILEQFNSLPKQNPVELFEAQLSVPFFSNLIEVFAERLPSFSDDEAWAYLNTVMGCIFSRHPEFKETNLGEWLIVQLASKLGADYIQRIFKITESGNETDTPYWFDDVLKAANAEHLSFPHPEIPGDRAIGFEGLMMLDKIVQLGDKRLRDVALKIPTAQR